MCVRVATAALLRKVHANLRRTHAHMAAPIPDARRGKTKHTEICNDPQGAISCRWTNLSLRTFLRSHRWHTRRLHRAVPLNARHSPLRAPLLPSEQHACQPSSHTPQHRSSSGRAACSSSRGGGKRRRKPSCCHPAATRSAMNAASRSSGERRAQDEEHVCRPFPFPTTRVCEASERGFHSCILSVCVRVRTRCERPCMHRLLNPHTRSHIYGGNK